jgi:CRP-like cAMP-binding protein
MLNDLIKRLKEDTAHWEETRTFFQEREIKAKTTLVKEGDISRNLYFIQEGCLRLWFNNEGKDITFQFFFENQAVSSFESFLEKKPSQFSLESIEPCKLVLLSREHFDLLFKLYPDLKDGFQKILIQRLGNYANLFLSRIKDSPEKRYHELLAHHPEILQRIPQHYIASYLGITPISLSRIRNRK